MLLLTPTCLQLLQFQYWERFKGKENQETFFSVLVITLPNQLSVYRASLCHLWPLLGFWSESLGTVCCLIEPSEIILGEGYFCEPEYIDWKFFSPALQ